MELEVRNENLAICRECGGACCIKCGCDYTVGDFKDRTSINITIGEVEDTTADNHGEDITINQSGIVGFFADTYALGVTNLKEHAGADRNNGECYTNYTQGATFGYFNDLSENAVVFIVADVTP